LGILLAGCSQETKLRFGESLLLDRSSPQLAVNAVRPIWSCDKSPDPRYPCVGVGPEGLVRDLVARPFANKRVMTIKDVDRDALYRIRFTWFSMQGSCGGSSWDEQLQSYIWPVVLTGGRTYFEPVMRETNLTRLSAEKMLEARLATGKYLAPRELPDGRLVREPHFPPQNQCDADYMDRSAGSPFRLGLKIYVPDPESPWVFGDAWIEPSKRSLFDTGCREEQRNGLTWRVCAGSVEKKGGPNGTYESKRERWVTPVSDSGFVLLVWAEYREPLFFWPQWYAERQASLLEMIDSIRVEELPLTGNEPNFEKEWPLR
ncbi:MAG: hypothetical protein ACRERY_18040, partial [Pseudomonas sp.]